jgi:hypothetical protein
MEKKEQMKHWFKAERAKARKVKNLVLAAEAAGMFWTAVVLSKDAVQKVDRMYRQ